MVPDLDYFTGVLAGFTLLLAVPPAGFLAAGLVLPAVGFFSAGFRGVAAGFSADDLVAGFFTLLVVGLTAVLDVTLPVEDVFPATAIFFTGADVLAPCFTGVLAPFSPPVVALTVVEAILVVFLACGFVPGLGVVLALVLAVDLVVDLAGAFMLDFTASSSATSLFTATELVDRVDLGLTAGFAGDVFDRGMPGFSDFLVGAAFAAGDFSAERVRFG